MAEPPLELPPPSDVSVQREGGVLRVKLRWASGAAWVSFVASLFLLALPLPLVPQALGLALRVRIEGALV